MTHAPTPSAAPVEPENDRREAIAFVMDAFDAAHRAGIDRGALSRAALFQAIMQIVDELGEEGAIRFLKNSATGVERGYYTRDMGSTSLN